MLQTRKHGIVDAVSVQVCFKNIRRIKRLVFWTDCGDIWISRRSLFVFPATTETDAKFSREVVKIQQGTYLDFILTVW